MTKIILIAYIAGYAFGIGKEVASYTAKKIAIVKKYMEIKKKKSEK